MTQSQSCVTITTYQLYSDDEWDESGDDTQGLTPVDDDEEMITITHQAPQMIQ